ncbi:hypothetical protein EZV73_23395 [Acidaminobacter sp. JC074]|uniref:hypothetical protein n=1 Tax=Acidaminobacter sp. JC074 TaxID=2530199 RepID=UPI001F0EE1ED|nr:hypothetical protein [Acidaminobacter sp. JC074]MCH4890546.1 hypothetical protein [Acidaminobacter sp. JC074]
MIKLLKYEVIKKWKVSLSVLFAFFLTYFLALTKFKADGMMSFEEMPLRVLFFILLSGALCLLPFIGAINSMRLEVKNKTRDLYFALPLTAYKKIGSKVIIAALEMTVAYGVAVMTCFQAIESLTGFQLMNYFNDGSNSFSQVLVSLYMQLVAYLLIVLIIYLSFAILRTFFSQIRFGGMITAVIYVVLMYLHIRYVFPFISLDNTSQDWLQAGLLTIYTGLIFALVGYLFEKRVSFE